LRSDTPRIPERKMSSVKKLFLTPAEVAEITGFSVHTIRRACREGRLRTVQLGLRGVRVPAAWLDQLMKQDEGDDAK
jgi:excisionase family DNA binding protein